MLKVIYGENHVESATAEEKYIIVAIFHANLVQVLVL
jgi:hypothetical protein